jgi:uncharacterized protein YycO
MKYQIFGILALLTVGLLIYHGTHLHQFAAGVRKNVPNVQHSMLESKLRNGDIIFQTSKSSQSKAIQLATNSTYSHMGILYRDALKYYVYEAIQPVKMTPLKQWIDRGEGGHFVVKRLRNAAEILTPETLAKMKKVGERFKGKDYDLYFEWSDDKIYCSELVWKIYKEGANTSIGVLQKLSDFDLNSEIVKQKIKERFGDNVPMDEKVISPVAIFNSKNLKVVLEK